MSVVAGYETRAALPLPLPGAEFAAEENVIAELPSCATVSAIPVITAALSCRRKRIWHVVLEPVQMTTRKAWVEARRTRRRAEAHAMEVKANLVRSFQAKAAP